jgi:hypothetical protein
MSDMTKQEAVIKLEECWSRDARLLEALHIACNALRASIPHVLTLDEASRLDPHTAVYAQFRDHNHISRPFSVEEVLPDGDWPEYGKTVVWWTAWPDEELRKATGWEAKE